MSDTAGRDGGGFLRGRTTLAVYGLVGYFAYMETVLGPLMPFLKAELDLSYSVAGLHFSAFALGSVLFGLSGDRFVGRWGRRAALWSGAVGMAAGALVVALGRAALATVPGTLFMGASGALLLVTTEAFLADRHGEWVAVALSESNVVAGACALCAPLLVGALASSGLGWRSALGPPAILLCLLAVRFWSEPFGGPPAGPEEGTGGGDEEFRDRLTLRYWAFWGLVSLGVAAEWCVGYWGADFLATGKGLSRPGAATALTLFFVAMLAGRLLGSRLARRISPQALLTGALCVALVGFLAFWLSWRPEPALVGLFITGLGVGNVYPLGVSSALAAATGNTDAAAARLAVGGGGAVLLAPLLLGTLADRVGMGAAFGVVPPILLAAVALAIAAGRGTAADG